MADSIRANEDILRQIRNLQISQSGTAGQPQQTGGVGAASGAAGVPVTAENQPEQAEKANDLTRFTDEVKEIKGNSSSDVYTPAVQALLDQLQNFISTGMDNPQQGGRNRQENSPSSTSDNHRDIDSQFRELFDMPRGKEDGKSSKKSEAKDKLSNENFESDPETFLKNRGSNGEASRSGNPDMQGAPYLTSEPLKGKFKSSLKENSLVKQGDKLGNLDLNCEGGQRSAFTSALEKMVSKSMGVPVTIDADGQVRVQSQVKINSIAQEEDVEQGKTPMTVDNMSGLKPFEEFMKGQTGDEYSKAREYLAKNSEAPDADWVKNRVASLEKKRDGQIPHNRELMTDYQSLWSDGKRLNS